jgi:hypothetical protein
MASLNGLFSDPKKLTAVSDFLLGFSQGTQKANVPGASPFGAIGAGFATGGQNVKHAASQRAQAAQQQEEQRIAMLQKQQQMMLNQQKIRQAQIQEQAEASFNARRAKIPQGDTKSLYSLALAFPNSPTAKAMLPLLKPSSPGKPIKVRGPDGKEVYVSPQDAIGMSPADDLKKAEFDLKVRSDARAQAEADRKAQLYEFEVDKLIGEKRDRDYEIVERQIALNTQGSTAKEKDQLIQQEIDKALGLLEENPIMGAGFMGSILKYVGGTQASNIESALITIKANLGFEQMQAMKNATPTGATGLGQIAIKEFEALQAVVRSLDQKQESEQLVKSLEAVSKRLSNWSAAVQAEAEQRGASINSVYGGTSQQQGGNTAIDEFTIIEE